MKDIWVVLAISILVCFIWLKFMNYPGAFGSPIDVVIYWVVALFFVTFPSLVFMVVNRKKHIVEVDENGV